jgi:hypothetical protein
MREEETMPFGGADHDLRIQLQARHSFVREASAPPAGEG